jgi:DNA polymerase III sliding clamp (beta) subunit (PCNA family)
MSSLDSINREALIKLINLARPALASQDYIPAYKHFCFSGGFVSAFNDVAAIQIALPTRELDLGLCLPGDMLIKSLHSFNAEKVMLQPTSDGALLVTSGRSKIKMPTLPAKDFPLSIPELSKTPVLTLGQDITHGIQRCLVSASNDPTHPATMGVTLDQDDGRAVLFSTDNATISRYQTKTKVNLPGDSPVILPTFFCEQLVTLAKAFPKAHCEVELHPGALVVYFFDENEKTVAVLFQKTLVDLEPLDFPKIIAKHLKTKNLREQLAEIPSSFDAAFGRALLVLSSELDKVTKISPSDDAIKLLSTSAAAESADSIVFNSTGQTTETFYADPTLVARACKACTHLAFLPSVLVMANNDASFVHLISHCSA